MHEAIVLNMQLPAPYQAWRRRRARRAITATLSHVIASCQAASDHDVHRLQQLDRRLAAYEAAYGIDTFVHEHTLHMLINTDASGFCLNWQLALRAQSLTEQMICALDLTGNMVTGKSAIRLWWSDLSDEIELERLAACGPRPFDQDRPGYGLDPAWLMYSADSPIQ